ncbi:MAG: serine hydrolase, partial [Vicinamibacterales bacterium]
MAIILPTSARHWTAVALVAAMAAGLAAQSRPTGPSRFNQDHFAHIDQVVLEALKDRALPGAVVVVGDSRGVVYEKAFGQRAIEPVPEPMTLDTVFDLASLTKVVATTTAVMQLVESGRLGFSDPVARYIPEFAKYDKGRVTIAQLMTHTSGLRPDLDLSIEWQGRDEAIRLASEEVLTASPGSRFVYSDINFFLLGHIVERVSGQTLEQFVKQRVFEPLRMRDTQFTPPASLRTRIAPTQWCTPLGWPCTGSNLVMLRGVVHDPTARRMGGVAGHAGLFSTATDLSRFARLLLNAGTLDGTVVLSPLAVRRMTTPVTVGDPPNVRGLGWDIDSTFSSNRGELMTAGSFGHTGFTGTSLWIDPTLDVFVVFLSNRVHPSGMGDVTLLRGRVASIAAGALRDVPRAAAMVPGPLTSASRTTVSVKPPEPVQAGIDVLRHDGYKLLAGKRVGLVTNQTGRALDGSSTIDLLHEAPGVSLVALFSPEHGIRGTEDALVESSRDERTGLVVHSLYGRTRRPTDAMLDGIDTLVIDIQDIGVRFYTYVTTMAYVL